MMSYEMFKAVVEEKFKDYLPEEYANGELQINAVQKVNRTMDGLILLAPEGERKMSPTIYINEMYNHYKETGNLQGVLKEGAESMVKGFQEISQFATLDVSTAKDNIVFQLINTEQNKEMLPNVPHRQFEDLSIIYRWVTNAQQGGIQSVIVTDDLAERFELKEEELFQLASENTRRIFPPIIKSMYEMIKEIIMEEGMPEEMLELMSGEMPSQSEQKMWVISNEQKIHGAASMLYEDKLHTLAMKLEDDLFIMPSSVHEVIAVAAGTGDLEYLAEMVTEINLDQVALDERLSNQVYRYDKDLRTLSLATNTPNKRLDGIVADQSLDHDSKLGR